MLHGFIPSINNSPAPGAVGNDGYTTLLLTFDSGFLNEGIGATARRVGTPYGVAKISGPGGPVGGSSSMDLSTSGSYLHMPGVGADLNLGAGSFTIDWWEYRTTSVEASCFVRGGPAADSSAGYLLGYQAGGRWLIYMSNTASDWAVANAVDCGAVQLNVWNHFAVVRNGNTFYCFKNGVQVATWSSSLSVYPGTTGVWFGPWAAYFVGYMDQIRFSKGCARWTSNFNPPTRPYGPIPDYSAYYTVSLLHGDGTPPNQGPFFDSSPYAKGVGRGPGVSQYNANYKFGGSSIYLDYNSSYIYHATSEDFNFGYGDFTIDWWDYHHDAADSRPTLVRDSAGLTYQPFLIGWQSAGTLYCYASNDQATWNIIASLSIGSFTAGAWAHRALVRKGNTFYGFKDGVLQATQTSSASFPGNNGSLIWAYWNYGDGSTIFGGYENIDEFRISKGIARWTANFTPPTQPYTP